VRIRGQQRGQQRARELVSTAVEELAPVLGLASACSLVGISKATWYRWQSAPSETAARAGGRAHPRALSGPERARVLEVLKSERFERASPHAVYATLMDEGVYLASVSTMYRLIREAGQPRPRTHRIRRLPGGVDAERPDQVWVRLRTSVGLSGSAAPGELTLVADAFSRCPVSWTLVPSGAEPGRKPASDVGAARRHPGQRVETVEVETWGSLMAELGVRREALVDPTAPVLTIGQGGAARDLPASPVLPSLEAARRHLDRVWTWFAHEYRHPDLGYFTPHEVHSGAWVHTWRSRAAVLAEARSSHPERFVHQPRLPQTPPGVEPTVGEKATTSAAGPGSGARAR
jgi:putative transposase